ncbi:hypothetical protein [Streptomonospora arabica]|uniref:Integrase catalytic domain-containing protein n=1 Tax=Streptomonospora arabica TaxID=412417 RepID=A0ABV9SPG5_9ACTN
MCHRNPPPPPPRTTCAGFLRRAIAWFTGHGVPVQRVLTDNAWAYSKAAWKPACSELGIHPR